MHAPPPSGGGKRIQLREENSGKKRKKEEKKEEKEKGEKKGKKKEKGKEEGKRVCVALSMAADEDYIIKDEVSSQSTSSGEHEATYYGQ